MKVGVLPLILLIFAFVCFTLDAFWVVNPPPPRVKLWSLGLAFATLAYILQNVMGG